MVAAPPKTRKSLSVEKKVEIIRTVETGRKKSDIAKSTTLTILKMKDKILNDYELIPSESKCVSLLMMMTWIRLFITGLYLCTLRISLFWCQCYKKKPTTSVLQPMD